MKFRAATEKYRTSNLIRGLEKAKTHQEEKKILMGLIRDIDKRLTNIEDFLGKP